jgi:Tfp pilus assembly protein PilN
VIEVNLLPGGRKQSARRRRLTLSLPRLKRGDSRPSIPRVDPWTSGAAAAVIIALLGSGWLALGVAGEVEELEMQVEVALRDSIRLADVMERSSTLQARRDSIAERVAVIQEIDGARYVWPHLMDEVARALPDYTWMVRLLQISRGEQVLFRLEGRAGTYFALTSFMENLEASPFIRGVRLLSSEQTPVTGEGGVTQLVYEFVLEASSADPPPEIIETVPLFGPSVLPPEPGG